MFIDSHAHLMDDALFPQIQELLQRALLSKVETIVNICTDSQTLKRGIAMQTSHPKVKILLTAATTPHDVEKEGESFWQEVVQATQDKKLVALGETGLDYYYEHSPKELQKKYLIQYFRLGIQTGLPVIFHCRDAFEDLFMLGDAEYKNRPALVHCFTGNLDEAKSALDRGWSISFSGIITFKKSEALREVVKYVPLDKMLIETDAPYLAPQSKRGSVNEPSFLPETAQVIADLKKVPLETVAKATSENARAFFSFENTLP